VSLSDPIRKNLRQENKKWVTHEKQQESVPPALNTDMLPSQLLFCLALLFPLK